MEPGDIVENKTTTTVGVVVDETKNAVRLLKPNQEDRQLCPKRNANKLGVEEGLARLFEEAPEDIFTSSEIEIRVDLDNVFIYTPGVSSKELKWLDCFFSGYRVDAIASNTLVIELDV